MENAEKVVKIRSNLNSSNEFSVKSADKDDPRILTIKIERSKGKGSQEIINEITDAEYKALKKDKIFNVLLENGDLQVLRAGTEKEESEDRAFSMAELENHAANELETYKEGEGKALIESSLETQKLELDNEYLETMDGERIEAVKSAKAVWETEAKTKLDEAVRVAVNDARNVLNKKHNKEKSKGNLTNW